MGHKKDIGKIYQHWTLSIKVRDYINIYNKNTMRKRNKNCDSIQWQTEAFTHAIYDKTNNKIVPKKKQETRLPIS